MDLSRPFYDSNIEALRVNADGTHDKVRLGDLRVGDVVMTADARGGVLGKRVTHIESCRQATRWFVADINRYEELNPTGTTGTYESLADGIAVGERSHLLNAHPAPVRPTLHDGSKAVGALRIIGGARQVIVNGDGLADAASFKFFLCAGHFASYDFDKLTVYSRVIKQACRALSPDYKVTTMRRGGMRLLVQYRNEEPVAIPLGPRSDMEIYEVPVRVQTGEGWRYLRTPTDLDDVLTTFTREHAAAATWRTVEELAHEMARTQKRQIATEADVLNDVRWVNTEFARHIVMDRLVYTAKGEPVQHAFMIHGIQPNRNYEDIKINLDAWVTGFWAGDGCAGRSEFSIGLPTDPQSVVPPIGRMQRYINQREFDNDAQSAEFVVILQRLGQVGDAHHAKVIFLYDERERDSNCIRVGLRRRGAFEGDASVMRHILTSLNIPQVYERKQIDAEAFAIMLHWDEVASLSFEAGVVDADGSGPIESKCFLGTSLSQSLNAGHKHIMLAFAFIAARYGFDVRMGLKVEESQPPAYFSTVEELRADAERRAQMTPSQRSRDYRTRLGVTLMTKMTVIIQGQRMSKLPLAVETKRDIDRDVFFSGINLLAFKCVDGGMRDTTSMEVDGAFNILTAHGFALGVGSDFSTIKLAPFMAMHENNNQDT